MRVRGRFEEFPLRVLKKQSLNRELRRKRRLSKRWHRTHAEFNDHKTVRLYTIAGLWYLAYGDETNPHNMTGGWDNKWKAISWFVRDGR